MRGKVKWFNEEKGFGFITCEDGQDAFVHIHEILTDGKLVEGQAVDFEREKGPKGLRANSVSVVAVLLMSMIGLFYLAGCSGVAMSSAMTAVSTGNAANAVTLRPQAQAGTLNAQECLSIIVNAGEAFKTDNAQRAANWPTYAFGKDKGVLFTDQNYIPAFSELAANAISRENAALGKWAVTPPSLAYLNAAAAQSLRDLVIVEEMRTAVTAHVGTGTLAASVKVAMSKVKVKATTALSTTSLAELVAAKMPAGWISAYNGLPANIRADVDADLPIVVFWAEDQLSQWWKNYTAGDTVAAKTMVYDTYPDEARAIAGQAAADGAEAAINKHVDSNLVALNAVKTLLLDGLPWLIGALLA